MDSFCFVCFQKEELQPLHLHRSVLRGRGMGLGLGMVADGEPPAEPEVCIGADASSPGRRGLCLGTAPCHVPCHLLCHAVPCHALPRAVLCHVPCHAVPC